MVSASKKMIADIFMKTRDAFLKNKPHGRIKVRVKIRGEI